MLPSRDTHVIFRNLKWNPKTWTMTHEQIVAMAIMNQTHQAIAMTLDVSPGLVTQVLNSEKGRKYKAHILAEARKQVLDTIPERMDRLVDASLSVVEEVMIDRRDEMMASPRLALAMVDRAALILKGAGKLAGDTTGGTHITTVNISTHHQNQLVTGLDRLREVWAKHGVPEGAKEIASVSNK